MIHLESFFDKFKNKNSSRHKLANKLVEFFNSVSPELKCFYETWNGGIYVNSRKRTTLDKTPSLLIIEQKTNSFGGTLEYIPITLFHNLSEHNNVTEFLLDVFDYSQMSFEIKYDDVDSYIEKLTKENFNNFLLEKETNKYNL